MPRFLQGNDEKLYAVFHSTDDAYAYLEKHGGFIACFGGYENAVCVCSTIGLDGVYDEL